MNKIILLGKPGSGKGTIAKTLENKGYTVLSGSEILRENSQSPDAKYYKEAKHALDSGILISSDLINLMVSEKINQVGKDGNFVFDGYPRTVDQVNHLFTIFPKEDFFTLMIDIDDETLKDRVLNRLTCKNCSASFNSVSMKPDNEGVCDHCGGELYQRVDDNEETLQRRLEQYEMNTHPVIMVLQSNTLFSKLSYDSLHRFWNSFRRFHSVQ